MSQVRLNKGEIVKKPYSSETIVHDGANPVVKIKE